MGVKYNFISHGATLCQGEGYQCRVPGVYGAGYIISGINNTGTFTKSKLSIEFRVKSIN